MGENGAVTTDDAAASAPPHAPAPVLATHQATEQATHQATVQATHHTSDQPPAPSRRSTLMSVTGLAASVLLAVLTVLPSPYALGGPGPTFDTLGTDDAGVPLVTIAGAPTYPASGELRLTTVSVSRAGSQPFTLGKVLAGWASRSHYVTPQERVFGTPEEETKVEEQAQVDWVSSQESATVSALEALGKDVGAVLTVKGTAEVSNAAGLLLEGDIIVAVDGQPVGGFSGLADAVDARAVGDQIAVTVVRDRAEVTESFATIDDGTGQAVIGVYVDPAFDLPIEVEVGIDTVGGPSAGLMFSLGIMDLLTEDDELGGARIAGTGTINASGRVGAIGGIALKMNGAASAGSEWFLAPTSNCAEVRGNIPDGLTVVAVETLDQAYEAVTRIGRGDGAGLPSC